MSNFDERIEQLKKSPLALDENNAAWNAVKSREICQEYEGHEALEGFSLFRHLHLLSIVASGVLQNDVKDNLEHFYVYGPMSLSIEAR